MRTNDKLSDREKEHSEEIILKRLLAMPPQPKTKPQKDASPKKRGRPPKAKSDD